MAIVIVELTVKDGPIVVALNRAAVRLVYVVVLGPLVPFGESSARTTDHRYSLMMVARNHGGD